MNENYLSWEGGKQENEKLDDLEHYVVDVVAQQLTPHLQSTRELRIQPNPPPGWSTSERQTTLKSTLHSLAMLSFLRQRCSAGLWPAYVQEPRHMLLELQWHIYHPVSLRMDFHNNRCSLMLRIGLPVDPVEWPIMLLSSHARLWASLRQLTVCTGNLYLTVLLSLRVLAVSQNHASWRMVYCCL